MTNEVTLIEGALCQLGLSFDQLSLVKLMENVKRVTQHLIDKNSIGAGINVTADLNQEYVNDVPCHPAQKIKNPRYDLPDLRLLIQHTQIIKP